MQVVFWMQDGKTPLWFAASRGHLEFVRLLVEKGANLNRAANVRRTGGRGGGAVIDLGKQSCVYIRSDVYGRGNIYSVIYYVAHILSMHCGSPQEIT